MSYDPSTTPFNDGSGPFGYVQATATTNINIGSIVFDLPSEQNVTASAGDTDLPSEALCIMRVGRNDDASGEARYWYTLGGTSPAISGCVDVITTKYWHGAPEAFEHTSTLNPTQKHKEGTDSINTSAWSHVMYWRT